jgi:type VI secretion system protein ImpF
MPELTPQDRLQPALLERLTDEQPDKTQETRERRVMSKAQLKHAVLRDLAWLFNSTRLERARTPIDSRLPAGDDLTAAPEANRSVINFGLPPLSGRAAVSMDITELERAIRQAIIDFEPRILPATLRVKAIVTANAIDHHNVIGVQIQGQLWSQPVPLELLVRTEIDLETGKVEIADLARTPGV